jgi:alpha/beta hydrolase fold
LARKLNDYKIYYNTHRFARRLDARATHRRILSSSGPARPPRVAATLPRSVSDTDRRLTYISPATRANSLAGLAPAVVCTAWFDPLRGEAYADALQAAGVSTKRHQGAGLIHGYFGMDEASEAARLEANSTSSETTPVTARPTAPAAMAARTNAHRNLAIHFAPWSRVRNKFSPERFATATAVPKRGVQHYGWCLSCVGGVFNDCPCISQRSACVAVKEAVTPIMARPCVPWSPPGRARSRRRSRAHALFRVEC